MTKTIYFVIPFLCCLDLPAQIMDPALIPPSVNTSPLPKYDYDRLDYGMTIGIERTPKGRIWVCWTGGGDSPDAFFVLASSDDNGESWSKPKVVIDPHDINLGEPRRCSVGNLWSDPLGRLWLFFDQSMSSFDGRAGTWYTICENPDSDQPVWSRPERIWHGCALNKPIVLKDGTWVLPVSLWQRWAITLHPRAGTRYKESYHELDSLRMANVFTSSDKGKSWSRAGGILFPKASFDEHIIVEKNDGSLWMTARTNNGIWESSSINKGKTWSVPQKFMECIGSRHFIRRLSSGRLLLVKNGGTNEQTKTRSKLMAFLSDDDGKTWRGGLMLDERRGVSYPDGFQSPEGTIYISYDRNRDTDGEVLLARFTENDVLEGRFWEKNSRARILICKPLGLDQLPQPSTRNK